jgi:PAS domain S-box-containing protein
MSRPLHARHEGVAVTQHAEHAEPAEARRLGARAFGPGWPAVVVTDPDGVVVHWSDSAEAVYGWADDEALGRTFGELVGDATSGALLGDLAAREPWEGACQVRHRDGTTFVAHVRDTPVRGPGGDVVAVVGLSYPVGEDRLPLLAAERGLRTSAERDADRLRRLQQVTAELSAALTTDAVIDRVLTRGMELEGAGSGAVWLLDERAGGLRYAAAIGAVEGMRETFAILPLDADLPGPAVVRSGRSIYLTSRADRDARWPRLVGTPTDMEALAIVPLVVDDRAIGCLSFGFPEAREFGAGEQDFLTALANVCAQVLDRARLYEAERAASGRVAFLAEASHLLNTSLDYETTLQRVVALLLETFAAAVVVDVLSSEGALTRVAMGHADPEKRDVLERLRGNSLRPGTAAWEVLRTGDPQVLPEVTDDALRDATDSAEMYEAALAMAFGPSMVVPLTARGRTVGILYVTRERGDPAFTDEDLSLAVDLAARAGSAVDNARLFAARTAVAETLQRSLLPPRLPDVPGLELGARYRPAHAGVDVGGDFYDCYDVGEGWAFMLGDVVGSGPHAAAITALVRHTARAVAPYVAGPVAVVRAIGEALHRADDDEVFCTLLYGSVSRVAAGLLLTVVGAGHPPPYVVRADRRIERVAARGSLLGPFPVGEVDPVEVLLEPGDALVAVTDGVLEARPARAWDAPDRGDFFDECGLLAVLARTAGMPAADVAGEIEAAVLEFTGGHAPDDVAVLVLRAT